MNHLNFVICINPENCEDLTLLKVYQVLPNKSAARDNYIRIIDDSDEDYLYPSNYFLIVELPEIAQKLFTKVG